jgi:hypothetical protein
VFDPVFNPRGFPRLAPIDVLVRAGVMLSIAREGLREMGERNPNRVTIGLFSVVVFGRSVTLALQKLRTYDEPTFNAWYAPWQEELRADPLCRFFNTLRSAILKDIEPMIAVRLTEQGSVGEAVIDLPLPTSHKGKPIHDPTLQYCCELYVACLQEVVKSATPLVMGVQERWKAAQGS